MTYIDLPEIGANVVVTARYGDGSTTQFAGTLTDVTEGAAVLTTVDSRKTIARRHITDAVVMPS